jgi:DNA-directed RNA polymerase specialized sigma24 family protein
MPIVSAETLSSAGRDPGAEGPDLSELVRRYCRGESCRQIAEAVGLGLDAVHGRLRRAGVEMRGPSASRRLEAEVARRYREGESLYQIADATNISRPTVRRLLKRSGAWVPRRFGVDRRQPVPLDTEAIIRRHSSGEPMTRIALSLHVSPGTIRNRLKAAGALEAP